MVVLAASIVTKSGKALVSRQYVDMSRIRIEGLLAAFPKLVGSNKQHTYVEAENVRYLYQPLENMYLVLVTNKNSNILEDLETLRLLGKVVPEYVMPLEEEVVQAAAFDLIFAFDEVISIGGFKENVTTTQVRQNTEMESHEEKLHKMIIQSKINETKDIMKKKAMEIERVKMEASRGVPGGRGMGSVSSYGPQGGMGGGPRDAHDVAPSYGRPEAAAFGAGAAAGMGRSDDRGRIGSAGGGKKGMVLGKAGKGRDFLESLKAEGETIVEDLHPATAAAAPVVLPSEPVFLSVDEKVSVTLNKDGGLEGMEVQGTMALTVAREEDACVRVVLAGAENSGYQFKTHPNIDKQMYAGENVLGLKDPNRPFPTGAPLGILKWRFQTTDESLVPLTINCWPSVSGGQSYINIEYECTATFDLQNVTIVVPVPALHKPPQVNQIDGDWRWDSRKSAFVWTIELLDDTNRSGSCEFVVPAAEAGMFFPIDVAFSASTTLCDLKVDKVVNAHTGETIKYGTKTALTTEGYIVE